MDFISEKKATKRIVLLTFLIGVLPQLLRIVINCFYAYEVAGNHVYPQIVSDLCVYGGNILGQFSFFSILGILVYLSARNGLKGGGEITLLIVGLYAVLYCIQNVIPSASTTLFIFMISALMTALAVILSARKNVITHLLATLALAVSILGGIILLSTSGVALPIDDVLFFISYAEANLVIELLFVLVACRISKFLSGKMKGEMFITGKLVSGKNPVLLTMLIFDALYVLLSLITPTLGVIENIKEYGPPVNSAEWMSIIGVYLEALIIFVIGYASMRFSAGLIEGTYTRSEAE